MFRRSSSKQRNKPENYEKPPKKMKEKQERKSRPVSAQSARSSMSLGSHAKMRVTWRDPDKPIAKSGWLYKQDSNGKMKMWRKRWFVLADFCLYYYKDSKEEEILGNIILPSYTVSTLTSEDKINRKYSFKVEHAGMRTYYFSADSYSDMAQWISALQNSCSPLSPTPKPMPPDEEVKPFVPDADEDSKGSDSVKGKKRESVKSKKSEPDDDSEFGFNHVHSPSTVSSQSTKQEQAEDNKNISANQSTNNNKFDPEVIQKNGRLPSDSHVPQSPKEMNRPKDSMPVRRVEEQQQFAPVISSGSQRISGKRAEPEQDRRGRRGTPRNSQEQGRPASGSHQNRSSRRQVPANNANGTQMRQAPTSQQKNVRRENGESAYFSDTSGATDSSRFANSSDRSNNQRMHQTTNRPQVKRQDSLVKLGNWVMTQKMRQQSGSTLNSPQSRNHPQSNFDTASEFSSVSQQQPRKSATLSARGPQRIGPPNSRRYRARTYNEYMDPMEVASSTISMPPIQHLGSNRMFVAQTLPRPQSSENVDGMGQQVARNPDRRMLSSKSAGNIGAVNQYSTPVFPPQMPQARDPNSIKRAKSDYVYPENDDFQKQYLANFAKAQKENKHGFRAPRQQHQAQARSGSGRASNEYRSAGSASNSSSGGYTPRRSINNTTPRSANTPRYNDNVFTPKSDVSSSRSGRNNGQVFQFDSVTPKSSTSSKGDRMRSSARNVAQAATLTTSPTRQSGSNVEVKQIQKGQLRAFVLSARSPQTQLPPPERQIPLKANHQQNEKTQASGNERDIEAKLKRLNEMNHNLHQIFDEVGNLQSEKERLEAELSIVRSKLQSRYPTGSPDNNHQLTRDHHQLDQELGSIKAQLANAAQKLKEISRENEEFEYDVRKLKQKLVEELRNQGMVSENVYNKRPGESQDTKRKLEWELGRVEFLIEGLNNQKRELLSKMDAFNARKESESPLSPISPSSQFTATSRSPRNVKRTSMERRHPHGRPSYSSTSSGGTPTDTPVKKYFTLPGRGLPHATSVDSVTAESLAKTSRPTSARSVSSIGSTNSNLHRTKSAAERLFQTSYSNQASDHEAKEMKRLQKEIFRYRRDNLKSGGTGDSPRRHSNPAGMTLPTRSHMKVGIDVQMALKHHRMPKVLQRAKRDLARADAGRFTTQAGFDIDDLEQTVKQHTSGLYDKQQSYKYEPEDSVDAGHKETDLEPEEIHLDVNLTHQLIAPDKVQIPERYVDYQNVELSPAEEKMKHRKVVAIEKMLAKSGQQGSLPAVHLAAALAVEAGSVARAVALHASSAQRVPGDGQKDGGDRPVTDGSSSAGEEQEPSQSPLRQDPEYSEAYIV